MSLLAKVAFLTDEAENIFYTGQRVLESVGVNRFTPLGVLYILATESPFKERISGLIMNADPATIGDTAKEALKRKYPKTPGNEFLATQSLFELIDAAIKEAGDGVNKAGVDQIIIALAKMPERNGNDALPILNSLGIKENDIKRRVAESAKGNGKPQISDFTSETLKSDEPQAELLSRKKTAMHLLAALTKQKGANVILFGEEGSGRHGVMRQLVKDIAAGEFAHAKDWRIMEVNLSSIRESQSPLKAVRDIITGFKPKTIVLIDEVKAQDLALVKPFLEHQTPAILIAKTCEAKKLEGEEISRLERFAVPETTGQETKEMLNVHTKSLSRFHGVDISLTEPAYEAILSYGKLVTGLELPGAAIRLLDLIAAYSKLTGNRLVDLDDVAKVIAERTGVSLQALTESEREKLKKLDEIFAKFIVGQEQAKVVIKDALYSAYVGLKEKGKPIGSFVFLGPTGVGKTEMARALAKFLFDDEDALIRIDMSEYQERHTVARLIGSPPGYVGYDEGGQLTEQIRKKPFSIVLFDEFDKANPEVLNVLLQMLDAGRLTDGRGRTTDFSHTIVICTSNHGSSLFYQGIEENLDFSQVKKEVLDWFRSTVPPELFNRYDAVVVFDPLKKEEQAKILDMLLAKLVIQPIKARYSVEVEIDDAAKTLLLEKGFDAALGARPLKRIINERVRNPLAAKLLQEQLSAGEKICCKGTDDCISFVKS